MLARTPGSRGRRASHILGWFATAALVAGFAVWAGPLGSNLSGAATPACTSAQLVIWINTTGNGAAGSSYYNVNLTNLGPGSCTLEGYPGVSAVSLSNQQVGSAAGRDSATHAQLVTLTSAKSARGLETSTTSNTATAILQITEVENFPTPICHQIAAAGLRFFPPGDRSSKIIPFPVAACAKAGPEYLHVQAVEKYVNGLR